MILQKLKSQLWAANTWKATVLRKLKRIWSGLADAKQAYRTSVFQQLIEIARLRCAEGQLEMSEYFRYQLADSQRFSWSEKKRFFGHRMEGKLATLLTRPGSEVLAHNKFVFYVTAVRLKVS